MSLEEGAGLVCLGSFSLGICQHVETMSYDQLLPSSKGFLAEPGYTAWDRVSKSAQLWSGIEASKLHPPGLPFFFFFLILQQLLLLLISTSLVHFSAGFKLKWEREVML